MWFRYAFQKLCAIEDAIENFPQDIKDLILEQDMQTAPFMVATYKKLNGNVSASMLERIFQYPDNNIRKRLIKALAEGQLTEQNIEEIAGREFSQKQLDPEVERLISQTKLTGMNLAWLKKQLSHGIADEIRTKDKLEAIEDWVLTENINLLTSLPFENAYMKALEWHHHLYEEKETKYTPNDYPENEDTVYEYDDGWTIKQLVPASCKVEGSIMKHCVKGYADLVKEGKTTLFSLRDPNNYPHVTIEQDFFVKQVFGPQNSAPTEEDMKRLREFFLATNNYSGLIWTAKDADEFVQNANQLFDLETEEDEFYEQNVLDIIRTAAFTKDDPQIYLAARQYEDPEPGFDLSMAISRGANNILYYILSHEYNKDSVESIEQLQYAMDNEPYGVRPKTLRIIDQFYPLSEEDIEACIARDNIVEQYQYMFVEKKFAATASHLQRAMEKANFSAIKLALEHFEQFDGYYFYLEKIEPHILETTLEIDINNRFKVDELDIIKLIDVFLNADQIQSDKCREILDILKKYKKFDKLDYLDPRIVPRTLFRTTIERLEYLEEFIKPEYLHELLKKIM